MNTYPINFRSNHQQQYQSIWHHPHYQFPLSDYIIRMHKCRPNHLFLLSENIIRMSKRCLHHLSLLSENNIQKIWQSSPSPSFRWYPIVWVSGRSHSLEGASSSEGEGHDWNILLFRNKINSPFPPMTFVLLIIIRFMMGLEATIRAPFSMEKKK